MTTPLLEALAQAAPVPAAPKGFKPGFTYGPNGIDSVTLPLDVSPEAEEAEWVSAARSAGVPIPEDMTLQLVEARLNGAAWHRDPADKGAKDSAYTAPSWWYRFKVVPKSLWRGRDYDALMKDIRKAVRGKAITPKSLKSSEVVVLGDFQTGKRDYLGGTPELLERSEVALKQVLAKIRRTKPAEIVLIDVGDSTEGFASAPNAAQTNDLDQTEQVRVWRRIFWRWIDALSKFGVPVIVISVPSNHCRVRTGKFANGKPNDDWGIEALAQVADMASTNPEAYGHVTFYAPGEHDEHVGVTLAGGKVLGAFHGHQKGTVAALLGHLEGQAGGRTPIGAADIVFCGHFHNLQMLTWGDDRWLFVSPAMDNGSGWYYNLTGRKARAGVLTVTIDENGWRDLFVAWA